MRSKTPLALVVDDDPMQIKALDIVLKNFGMRVEVCTTSDEFLAKIASIAPDICLMDLNIESVGSGFSVIEKVRGTLGQAPTLIVISGESDRSAIAHAVEIGANDFLIKPLDKNLLATKIAGYVQTEQIQDFKIPMLSVPIGGVDAIARLDLQVVAIDEFSITLDSKHLLSKGMTFPLKGSLIAEITGSDHPLLVTATSTWVQPGGQSYGAETEFDHTNGRLMENIRLWLTKRESSK